MIDRECILTLQDLEPDNLTQIRESILTQIRESILRRCHIELRSR
jgi:hypothetical protein